MNDFGYAAYQNDLLDVVMLKQPIVDLHGDIGSGVLGLTLVNFWLTLVQHRNHLSAQHRTKGEIFNKKMRLDEQPDSPIVNPGTAKDNQTLFTLETAIHFKKYR
ncbi:MAG: hexokinase A [Watsoniomyces obsoletus]|nr:MAG: hexokinase A [Watsoniomyces obsoletus]